MWFLILLQGVLQKGLFTLHVQQKSNMSGAETHPSLALHEENTAH